MKLENILELSKFCEPAYISLRDLQTKYLKQFDHTHIWNNLLKYRKSIGKELDFSNYDESFFYVLNKHYSEKLNTIANELMDLNEDEKNLDDWLILESLASFNLSVNSIADTIPYTLASNVIEEKIDLTNTTETKFLDKPYSTKMLSEFKNLYFAYKKFLCSETIDYFDIDLIEDIYTEISGDNNARFNRTEELGTNKIKIPYIAANAKDIENLIRKLLIDMSYSNKDLSYKDIIVNAIVFKFLFLYIRPYNENNGRISRLLFYLYLIKNGITEVKKINLFSTITWEQFYFLYDIAISNGYHYGNDITYFLIFMLRMFEKSIDALYNIDANFLNIRQIELLEDLNNKKILEFSINDYMHKYSISRVSASKEINELQEYGFIKIEEVLKKTKIFKLK